PYSGNYPYALGTFSDPNGVAAGPWTWTVTWGDGSTGNGTTSSVGALSSPHFYLPGTYRAHVVVTNAAGASGDAYFNVTVAGDLFVGLAPVVVATEGVPTHLDFGFYDPYGPVVSGQYAIHVDWGDGSSQDLSTPNTSPITVSHTYAASDPAPGNPGGTVYTATVTVTDALGHTGSASRPEPVIDVAPVLTASPVAVPEGFSGQITLASFTDASVGPWSVFIDGGPGMQQQFQVQTPGPIQLPYGYSFGNHTFTVYVGDRGGLVSHVTVAVTVVNVAPVVGPVYIDGDVANGQPLEGGSVAVDASFDDPAGVYSTSESFTCTVDYGDGSGPEVGEVQNGVCYGPVHKYGPSGSGAITIAVTDSNGGTGSSSLAYSLVNVAPTVSAFMSDYNPDEWHLDPSVPSAVTASATFADPGFSSETYTCTADYGDGTVVAGVISGLTCTGPVHQYLVSGSYTVKVTVTDSGGASGIGISGASYNNRVPWVGGGLVGSFVVGSPVHDVAAVVDPGAAFETYTCTVDYGDGSAVQAGTYVPTGWSDGLPRCVGRDHIYNASGSYSIVTTVTDSGGETGSSLVIETIIAAPIVVDSVSAPATVTVGSSVSASATFTPSGNQTYACTVDYGDGKATPAGVVSGSTCQGPKHVYIAAGSFTITVIVTGSSSPSGTASRSITVILPPIAVGAVSVPNSIVEGSTVAASATFTATGLTERYTCSVDYGDNLGAQAGVVSGKTCVGPKHTYGRPGQFIVVLTVRGSAGTTGSATKSISVTNVVPTFTKVTIPATVKLGSAASMSATFTDPGTTESYQAVWTWGDDTSTTISLGAGVRSFAASHIYVKSGAYSVNVAVSDGGDTVYYNSGIAVYDPARTLTGSGTFVSSAGSCALGPKCAGASTGTFSFSASYAKGATKPTVCFSFSAAGVTFTETSAEYFTASDGIGGVWGTGTLNGVKGYRFSLNVVDGKPDVFVIDVLDSKGNDLYLNNGALPIKSGSITIK
ncbi:MAG TPA: PKD domain-containing protein, partial [Terriglobales bacterium]|nr:PKD domain-containing protein [Terriglobales bacterium]